MSRPIEQAEAIYRHLKEDDMFDHAGPESRHVLLQTDAVIHGVMSLASDTIDPYAKAILGYSVNMLKAVGEDGILVRMKGPNDIEIRGASNTPTHNGNPTPEELMKMMFEFENSIQLNLSGYGRMIAISVLSQDDTAEEQLNQTIQMIPEQAQIALVKGLLNIISENLNNILDS